MNLAFGITIEDLENVLHTHGSNIKNNSIIEIIFEELDMQKIEKAALYANEMEDQTTLAYAEIESQLKDLGHL